MQTEPSAKLRLPVCFHGLCQRQSSVHLSIESPTTTRDHETSIKYIFVLITSSICSLESSVVNLENKRIKLFKCYSDLDLDPTMPTFSYTTACFNFLFLAMFATT